MKYLKQFMKEEDAVGVVEIVLIIVVIVGLVLIFKDKIGELISKAFKSVEDNAAQIY